MHGWKDVETARCTRCAIYTPTTDLVRAADDRLYCTECGVPAATRPVPHEDEEWCIPPRPYAGADTLVFVLVHGVTEKRARLVAGLMVLAAIAFPLAACVSQL
jgi:hypothetical protein